MKCKFTGKKCTSLKGECLGCPNYRKGFSDYYASVNRSEKNVKQC